MHSLKVFMELFFLENKNKSLLFMCFTLSISLNDHLYLPSLLSRKQLHFF